MDGRRDTLHLAAHTGCMATRIRDEKKRWWGGGDDRQIAHIGQSACGSPQSLVFPLSTFILLITVQLHSMADNHHPKVTCDRCVTCCDF